MKYTTKIKQAQFIGKIKIEPKGGDLSEADVEAITADPWGKDLVRKGVLTIEGVKPSDIKDEPKSKKKAIKIDSNVEPSVTPKPSVDTTKTTEAKKQN